MSEHESIGGGRYERLTKQLLVAGLSAVALSGCVTMDSAPQPVCGEIKDAWVAKQLARKWIDDMLENGVVDAENSPRNGQLMKYTNGALEKEMVTSADLREDYGLTVSVIVSSTEDEQSKETFFIQLFVSEDDRQGSPLIGPVGDNPIATGIGVRQLVAYSGAQVEESFFARNVGDPPVACVAGT